MTATASAAGLSEQSWLPLIARVAGGDREAEVELIGRFQAGVRALARRHCRPNDPVVDDVVQDVLCHVLERLRHGAIKDAAALPAYIRTAVVNACTAEYRRRRLRGEPQPFDDTNGNLPLSEDLGDRLDAQRASLLIRQLIAELPVARDREILLKFYLQERSKEDVCRELGIDAGHFHRVIHRARERFRILLTSAGLAGLADPAGTAGLVSTPSDPRPKRYTGNGV